MQKCLSHVRPEYFMLLNRCAAALARHHLPLPCATAHADTRRMGKSGSWSRRVCLASVLISHVAWMLCCGPLALCHRVCRCPMSQGAVATARMTGRSRTTCFAQVRGHWDGAHLQVKLSLPMPSAMPGQRPAAAPGRRLTLGSGCRTMHATLLFTPDKHAGHHLALTQGLADTHQDAAQHLMTHWMSPHFCSHIPMHRPCHTCRVASGGCRRLPGRLRGSPDHRRQYGGR